MSKSLSRKMTADEEGADLVSVIVPVYRVERYLDECVSSIVEQRYGNLEIILVDDGSDDACPELCDAWADKDERIRVIHQANGGLSAARNTGLTVAHGRYVTFVDSDDVVDARMIDVLLSAMGDHEIDIAICGLMGVDDNNDHVVFRTCYETGTMPGRGALIDLLRGGGRLPDAAWGRLYRTELIQGGHAIRFPEGLHSEDYYFNAIAYHRAKTVHMDRRCLYRYRQRAGSITSSGSVDHREDSIRIADLVIADLKAEGFDDTGSLAFYKVLCRYDVLFTAVCCKDPRLMIGRYAAALRRDARGALLNRQVPLFRRMKILMLGHFPEWYVKGNLMFVHAGSALRGMVQLLPIRTWLSIRYVNRDIPARKGE
ncbi:glycosyltransferase family 2 protein [Bifidobacterium scaligerum]|uniref:Glycosyl transferase family 2 n=1 Tax=Bifidobacterium scaligerum TaxID=2052656 RepID=A0A2M9HS82_9BIFI|nr:glycosyltransferase [Bifidobacterium scaligerum]PJM79668.1 glycosyl transferase family 2 [Bifidobacterium scaligerum]